MRKIILLAAAPLLLAACSSDDNGPDSGDTRVPIRLTSGIEVQTRANTQGTEIASGETVYVWVDDDVTPGDADGTERIASPLYEAHELTSMGLGVLYGDPMYFPATGHNVDIYAIHGKIETGAEVDTQLKEFPDTYGLLYRVNPDQSTGTGYTSSDLLYAVRQDVARTTSTVPLTFYHMLSKIELAIKVGNGSPALADQSAVKLNDVTLNGKFTPKKVGDISDQMVRANMLGEWGKPDTGDMTLGQETCSGFMDFEVVYNEAIVVPQDMSGKTLTFSLADGGTLTYTIPANTTFESGKKYIYHITLDLTGLTVTSTVADWTTGSTSTGSATM